MILFLWQILSMIIGRKAIRQNQRERAKKRGGGMVAGESIFEGESGSGHPRMSEAAVELAPTPELMAIIDEEFHRLLEMLPTDELRKVALAKFEGRTNSEIADQLGRHVRSVERKLQIIRDQWGASDDDSGINKEAPL